MGSPVWMCYSVSAKGFWVEEGYVNGRKERKGIKGIVEKKEGKRGKVKCKCA